MSCSCRLQDTDSSCCTADALPSPPSVADLHLQPGLSMQPGMRSNMGAAEQPTCQLCARLVACLPDPEGSVVETAADQHGGIHGHCTHRASMQLAGRHRHARLEVPKLHGPVGGPCRHGRSHTSARVVQLFTVWGQDQTAGLADATSQQGSGQRFRVWCVNTAGLSAGQGVLQFFKIPAARCGSRPLQECQAQHHRRGGGSGAARQHSDCNCRRASGGCTAGPADLRRAAAQEWCLQSRGGACSKQALAPSKTSGLPQGSIDNLLLDSMVQTTSGRRANTPMHPLTCGQQLAAGSMARQHNRATTVDGNLPMHAARTDSQAAHGGS